MPEFLTRERRGPTVRATINRPKDTALARSIALQVIRQKIADRTEKLNAGKCTALGPKR